MTILEAVGQLRPGTNWNWDPEARTLTQVGEPAVEVPTMEEIDAVISANDYREKRFAAYPSIGDQLDALWKGGSAADAMQAKVNAVKAEYPKPA